jgi:heat shock protein HtpX
MIVSPQSASNKTKVLALLIIVSLLILMIGYTSAGRIGLFIGFVLTVFFHMTLLFFGKTKIIEHIGARKILGQDPWDLVSLVDKYSKHLQIPRPAIYICETPQVFAFSVNGDSSFTVDTIVESTGQNSVICFSTGLLYRLRKSEVEAIVARQVTQTAYLNTLSRNIAHVLAFSIIGLGGFLDHLWILNVVKRLFNSQKIQRPFSSILSPVAWAILKIPFSDQIYFIVDETTARLTNDRHSLAEALWKLEGYAQNQILNPPVGTHQYFAVNPFGLRETNKFLLTHPKVEHRIQKLLGYFPL